MHRTRTVNWLEPQWCLVVLHQPARRQQVGRRTQAIRTSAIAHVLRSVRLSMRPLGTLAIIVVLFALLGQPAWSETPTGPPPAVATPTASTSATTDAGGDNAKSLKSTIPVPHDLSPWSMFLSADVIVKAVMIGLAFASL